MKPARLKTLFYALLCAVVLLLLAGGWLAVRIIGGIDGIQAAAEDLEIRRVHIGARLRAQMHRLSATMLRYEVTGDDVFSRRFTSHREQLQRFLDEYRPLLDSPEEKELLQQIEVAIADYYEDAEARMQGRAHLENSQLSVARIERIKGELNEIIELANDLGEARGESFRKLLVEYRVSARGLQQSIFGALGLLLVVVAGLAWLAFRVFFRPMLGELREAQALAGRREELANLGTLASGIAHEIRNPLTAMKARAYALKAIVDDPKAIKQAEVIEGEIDRLERVVRSFLDFARPAEPDLEVVRLDEYLREIHELMLPELAAKSIEFSCLAAEGAEARIDAAQMKQVVLNLLRNAGEACPRTGGKVVLEAMREDRHIAILVRDNGDGIPEDYRKRLFEPFYSKKAAGTGLGLSIARNIVHKHGGELSFETGDGKGTTFTIQLPA